MIPVCRIFEQADLRDAMYLFPPLFLGRAFAALVLAVSLSTEICSDRNQSFRQDQTISKGAS